MSDVMLHGVLNMPLPDDPTECDLVTWVQFKDRARQASSHIEELEAKLAKAVEGLSQCEAEIDDYIRHEYTGDCPVQARFRKREFDANPARTTLAELKGQDDGS